jgi:hypothetical protein
MVGSRWKIAGPAAGIAMILPNLVPAQPQTTVTLTDQPNRVSVAYVQPNNSAFQRLYDLFRERRALEKIQEILSPARLPEELTIKTTECGALNSWYRRENFKPTVTICYELLKHILDSLPNDTTCRSHARRCSRWAVLPCDFARGRTRNVRYFRCADILPRGGRR